MCCRPDRCAHQSSCTNCRRWIVAICFIARLWRVSNARTSEDQNNNADPNDNDANYLTGRIRCIDGVVSSVAIKVESTGNASIGYD